jgi:hypothetical protein
MEPIYIFIISLFSGKLPNDLRTYLCVHLLIRLKAHVCSLESENCFKQEKACGTFF